MIPPDFRGLLWGGMILGALAAGIVALVAWSVL